jgi:hypothetical protein
MLIWPWLIRNSRIFSQKKLEPAAKRQLEEKLIGDQGVPVNRACKLVSSLPSQFYFSCKRGEKKLIEALQELVFKYNEYDFRNFFVSFIRSAKN